MTRGEASDWFDKIVESLFVRGLARAAMISLVPIGLWVGNTLIEIRQNQILDEANTKAQIAAVETEIKNDRTSIETELTFDRGATLNLFNKASDRLDILSKHISDTDSNLGNNYARQGEVQAGFTDRDHKFDDVVRRVNALEATLRDWLARPPEGRANK